MKPQKPQRRTDQPSPDQLPAIVESLLFIVGEPQEIAALARSLSVPRRQLEKAAEELIASRDGRGVYVLRLGDRLQLATIPEAAPYVEQYLEAEHGQLSRAALETLAIIAYRHPVTRSVIESVRGVNSDHAVATLLARDLIEEVGRAPGPGRPVLLAPAVRFLQYFGLQQTDDLPPLPELPEPEAAAEAPVPEGETAAVEA